MAVMLAEHVEGRGHVGALVAIGEGDGLLSADERDSVVEHALAYVPLLRAHIMKEDNILYPMAIQAIPHDEMEAMNADFEAFEANVMGAGEHEKFHALADRLVEAYPPDPVRMAEGSACTGCSGHM